MIFSLGPRFGVPRIQMAVIDLVTIWAILTLSMPYLNAPFTRKRFKVPG